MLIKNSFTLGSRDGIRRVSMRDLIARMSSIQKYMRPIWLVIVEASLMNEHTYHSKSATCKQ